MSHKKIMKSQLTLNDYKKLKELVEIDYENDRIILIDEEEWDDFELSKESKYFAFLKEDE